MKTSRKTILFIASSLDGYIAGPKGEINWLFTDQDYGYKKFYDSTDAIVMGRKTYDLSLTFGEWPYPGKKAFVLTRKKRMKKDARVEFVSEVNRLVKKLRSIKGNAWVVGGGEIVSLFLNHKSINEIRVFIHPLILGKGIPLLPPGTTKTNLKLLKTNAFNTGLVELHYRVEK